MEILKEIISNHMLIVPIISWAVCQILKFFTYLIVEGKVVWKRVISDGGMPSSHSATVVSLAVACGWVAGFDSAVFAVALIFAIVVMRDAVGVRRETGKQAASIKQLADSVKEVLPEGKNTVMTDKLKVLVGHTPLQVVCGAVIGGLIAILYIVIFLA